MINETPESGPVELQNKVVAVFESAELASAAAAGMSGKGHSVTVLEGKAGRARLPHNQEGLAGALKTAAAAFGDELRVLESLDEALARGSQVLVVEASAEDAAEVAAKLDEHDGKSVWSFGEWTFKPVTPDASDEERA